MRQIYLLFNFTLCIICSFIAFSCGGSSTDPIDNIPNVHFLTSSEVGSINTAALKSYWGNNDTANAFIVYDLNTHAITYNTTDLGGDKIEASGAILLPDVSPAKGIISIQHSTFFDDEEAPSENGSFSVVSRKSIFAAAGYIVILPDYLGYGIDKDRVHPYHHKESLTTASRDMILAAYEFLEDEEIQYSDKLFLAGYSEGAFATAALESDNQLTRDLNITAISAGSGAYDLKKTVSSFFDLEEKSNACLPCNAFFVQAYDDVYGFEESLDYYFQFTYSSLIEEGLLLGTFSGAEVNGSFPLDPMDLYTDQWVMDFQNGSQKWNDALDENSLVNWKPNAPTLLTHNQEDNVVPFFNSQEIASNNQGQTQITFLPVQGTNHFDGIFQWGILTLDYFNRF